MRCCHQCFCCGCYDVKISKKRWEAAVILYGYKLGNVGCMAVTIMHYQILLSALALWTIMTILFYPVYIYVFSVVSCCSIRWGWGEEGGESVCGGRGGGGGEGQRE